jgi:hypothetical protein
MDYPLTNQPFLPSSTYGMEQSYNASYDPMMPLDAQRPHDLHFHYDAIAQGVKPFPFHTPAASPHSTSHSFHEQPPILSASSESGASVSSSAIGSPTHFEEPWNTVGLGLTSGFEYPGMIAAEKTFVGESTVHSTSSTFSSVISPTTPPSSRNIFKTPDTPASANWSFARSRGRGNSLLSHQVHPHDVIRSPSHFSDSSLRSSQFLRSTCWFPSFETPTIEHDANIEQQIPISFSHLLLLPKAPFTKSNKCPRPTSQSLNNHHLPPSLTFQHRASAQDQHALSRVVQAPSFAHNNITPTHSSTANGEAR